jgi:hypothetical protein
VRARYGDEIVPYGIIAPETRTVDLERFPLLRDAAREFANVYDAEGTCLYLLRPDRHVGYRSDRLDVAALRRFLERSLRANSP